MPRTPRGSVGVSMARPSDDPDTHMLDGSFQVIGSAATHPDAARAAPVTSLTVSCPAKDEIPLASAPYNPTADTGIEAPPVLAEAVGVEADAPPEEEEIVEGGPEPIPTGNTDDSDDHDDSSDNGGTPQITKVEPKNGFEKID